MAMHRTEAQFCRDEATRLLELAKVCDDPEVRDHLAMMASEWLDRAKAKDPPPKAAHAPELSGLRQSVN
jgi:hypothetical protein